MNWTALLGQQQPQVASAPVDPATTLRALGGFQLTPRAPESGKSFASDLAWNESILQKQRASAGFTDAADQFWKTGDNYLVGLGAYAGVNPGTAPEGWTQNESEVGQTNAGYVDPTIRQFVFANREAMPGDFTGYNGVPLQFGDKYDMTQEERISYQSAKEAEQILKTFFPNVDIRTAAKAGYDARRAEVGVPFYWGSGPMPTVDAIVKQLGLSSPQYDTWAAQNRDPFAQRYQGYRKASHAADDARSEASFGDFLKVVSIIAPVAGPAMGLSTSNLTKGLSDGIINAVGATGDIAKAITTGVNSAANAGIKSIVGGVGSFGDLVKDVVIGGVSGAGASIAGNTVAGVLAPPSGVYDDQYVSVDTATDTNRFPLTGAVAGGAAGMTGGIINAAANGGDIGDAAATGLVAGAVGGGVGVDLGAGGAVGNVAGNLAGSAVANELRDDTVATGGVAATTNTTTTDTAIDTRTHDYALNWGNSPSFASLLAPRGRMNWGERLTNGRPA